MLGPQSLDSIGLKNKTDKASSHHDYLSFYEIFFSPLRNEKLKILEVGIFGGASLGTWFDYFPNAEIVGADITPATKRFERDRVSVEILDQSNVEQLTRMAIKHGPFDIVIEDGSHFWEHQITSLRVLFPFVKENGIYIVEDLQTNYGAHEEHYRGVASESCVEYLKKWMDLRVGDELIDIAATEDAFLRTYGRSIQFMTFYRHACLIKKQYRVPEYPLAGGTPLVRQLIEAQTDKVCVLAHLSNIGDVFGTESFVHTGTDSETFQGVTLETADHLLQYRVLLPNDAWTAWTNDGEFAGTRAAAIEISGVSIRLRPEASERYSLQVLGRFAGSPEIVRVSSGEDCRGPSGSPLCGLQIDLRRR